MRAVYRTKTYSYETVLEMAELPSLYNRRLQDIATYMYKIKNGLAPNSFNEIFSLKQSTYMPYAIVTLFYLDLILPDMANILCVISDQCYGQNWMTILRTCPVWSVSRKLSVIYSRHREHAGQQLQLLRDVQGVNRYTYIFHTVFI